MAPGPGLGEKKFVFNGNTLVGYGESGICDSCGNVESDGIEFTVVN